MAKVKVYLEVEDGVIVGYHNDEIEQSNLPPNTKIIEKEIDDPGLLLGLNEKFISSDTKIIRKMANKKMEEFQSESKVIVTRAQLKSLLIDIQLAEELDEDNTDLKKQFNTLKKEYKAIKTYPISKVDAGRTRTITLPNNKSNLNGDITPNNGSYTTVKWTKVKGGVSKITKPNDLSTTVTGLKKGTYEFKLSVTNDENKVISDVVKIVVKQKDDDD